MRRAIQMMSRGAMAAPAVSIATVTTTGLSAGVQEQLTRLPGQLFDAKAIKTATDEFLAFGFDDSYTDNFTHQDIANHVQGYLCAKAGKDGLFYAEENERGAFYITDNSADTDITTLTRIEQHIKKYRKAHQAASVRSYLGADSKKNPVILFDVRFPEFADASGKGTTLAQLASKDFAVKRSPEAVQRYSEVVSKLTDSIVPVFNTQQLPNDVAVINVGVKALDRDYYFDEIAILIAALPGAVVVKKFLETFSNNTQVYTFYVKGVKPEALADAVTMIGVLPSRPNHPFTHLFQKGEFNAKHVVYANSVSQFAYYFAAPAAEGNYTALYRSLEKDPQMLKRLKTLRNSMFQELMDEASISQVIASNADLLKEFYADFEQGHDATRAAALAARVDKEFPPENSGEFNALFKSFLTFNKAVKATNFFKTNRAAVAYRLDPFFIAGLDFPRVPYAIYMLTGAHFRGFHVRFHDIARGGVRLMLSKSNAEYKGKRKTLFQENYGLAYTQMLKNKDIPESGSKGTLLVSPRFDHKRNGTKTLFLQYVDALLDIMIPGVEGVRNTLPQRELLFLGPDENTAGDFPSAAAKYAKSRGFAEWKSLTTGKDSIDGGIPHDVFGMTTNSVREYLLATYEKLGWDQKKLVKFQTGGPDGDLGSNEILLGGEIQKAMCDISGCLYDPNGLNREELLRLAKERKQCGAFDPAKLSKGGFFLPSDAAETKLPDGSVWTGSQLLAKFHLTKYADADVFVPCGGRPNSVTIDNVHEFLQNAPGVTGAMMLEGNVANVGPENLKFKLISEGANLFITPDARIALENCGVILFKDSSANKGGVTSSSFEVYCGLAMPDEDHKLHMCCDAKKPTEMYDAMTKEIVARIRANARNEYDAITKDVAAGLLKGKRTLIADAYSNKMVDIFEFVSKSNLNKDDSIFRYVLTQYTPKPLLKQVGLDVILQRVPRAYLEAIFHKQIAINYIYAAGANSNEFSFFEYMRDLQNKAYAAFPPKK